MPLQGLSRMRCQGLLLSGKRHGWRRWWGFGDHRPASHCSRRRRYASRSICPGSQHALATGCYGSTRAQGYRSHLSRVHGNGCSGHGLCADEGALRHRSDRARYIPVHVGDIGDGSRPVDDGGVVDVGDGGVADRGVADVDPVDVNPAHPVGGHVNFPRAQREPSYIAAGTNAAGAEEDYQGGRVNRHNVHRSSNPAPTIANRHPAPVVKGRITPRSVIHPGPAPGRNPGPVAFAIGRPPDANLRGVPDMSVAGIVAPFAVIVQILISHYIMRNISCRARPLVAAVAAIRPIVKIIGEGARPTSVTMPATGASSSRPC